MHESRRLLVAIAAASALAFLVALAALPGAFITDDIEIVRENSRIDSVAKIPALFGDSYWGRELPQRLYRPLVMASFALEGALFGQQSARHYHVVNALLYALCAGLVVWLSRRVGASTAVAAAAGLLFAAHPIHTEAVANIVGRSELMAFCLVFIGLGVSARAQGATLMREMLAALCFLCAMFAKESAISYLPLCAFITTLGAPAGTKFWRALAQSAWRRKRLWICNLAALLLWMVMRARAIPAIEDAIPTSELDNLLGARPPLERVAGALAVLLLYFKMSWWPWPLSSDYSLAALTPPSQLFEFQAIAGILLMIALAALVVFMWRRAPLIALGAAIWIFCIAPVANLLMPIGTIFGERLLFSPSAGGCIALAAALEIFSKRRPKLRVAALGVVFVLVLLGAAAFMMRARDWQDEMRLFKADLRHHPQSAKLHSLLGGGHWQESLRVEGKEREEQLAQAQVHLERALAIYPRYLQARITLSLVLAMQGDLDRAFAMASEFHAVAPDLVKAARAYAFIATQAGHPQEALAACDRVLARQPRNLDMLQMRLEAVSRLGPLSAVVTAHAALIEAGDDVHGALAFTDRLIAVGEIESARAMLDLLSRPPVGRVQAARRAELEPAIRERRRLIGH